MKSTNASAKSAVGVLSGLLVSTSMAANVSFKDRFTAASQQDVVVISVSPDDVLVIEAGAYYTSGRKITISASAVQVAGDAVVGFFPPDSTPATISGVAAPVPGVPQGANVNCGGSGCQGSPGNPGTTGAEGTKGANGNLMIIDLRTLDGPGLLTLALAGQTGGKGQTGGQGGTGARGGDGTQRSCGGLLGLDTKSGPGNGGPGNIGGQGGTGGRGGAGGDTGNVVLGEHVAQAWATGKLKINLAGAMGGAGGDPGAKGQGGRGGGMGAGNSCGGGGSTGPDAGLGPAGNPGPAGAGAKQGTMRFAELGDDATPGDPTPDFKKEVVTIRAIGSAELGCANPEVRVIATQCIANDRVIVGVSPGEIRSVNFFPGPFTTMPNITSIATIAPSKANCTAADAVILRSKVTNLAIDPTHFPPFRLATNCAETSFDVDVDALSVAKESPLGTALSQGR